MAAGKRAPSFGTEPSDIQHRKADHTGVLYACESIGAERSRADEALADFQFYGRQALKSLAKMGVDYEEIQASDFVVKVGNATTNFRPVKGVGYYFVAPGKKPRVEYGVLTDSDLLHAARNYFALNEKER